MLFTGGEEMIRAEQAAFKVRVLVDTTARQLWVCAAEITDCAAFTAFMREQARTRECGKIIYPCPVQYAPGLQSAGFEAEAQAEGFFKGRPGVFMVLYADPERRPSDHLVDEVDMLRDIIEKPRVIRESPDGDPDLRSARRADLPALAALYAEVFGHGPVPVQDPAHLGRMMDEGVLFWLAPEGPALAGAAMARVNAGSGRAKLTGCAVRPVCRGRGLGVRLLRALENQCRRDGIACFYSLARAGQYGINLAFHRLGYRYRGTLINNARIGGRFENLNVWVKHYAG